jgi:hypothetical protein
MLRSAAARHRVTIHDFLALPLLPLPSPPPHPQPQVQHKHAYDLLSGRKEVFLRADEHDAVHVRGARTALLDAEALAQGEFQEVVAAALALRSWWVGWRGWCVRACASDWCGEEKRCWEGQRWRGGAAVEGGAAGKGGAAKKGRGGAVRGSSRARSSQTQLAINALANALAPKPILARVPTHRIALPPVPVRTLHRAHCTARTAHCAALPARPLARQLTTDL